MSTHERTQAVFVVSLQARNDSLQTITVTLAECLASGYRCGEARLICQTEEAWQGSALV